MAVYKIVLAISGLLYGVIATDIEEVRIDGLTSNMTVMGFAQVLHNNTWYSLCDHGWGDNDARVICKQLSYDRGVTYLVSAHIIQKPTDPIWTVEVSCTGSESDINQCGIRHTSSKCVPALVSCDTVDDTLPDGSLRIVDGPTNSSGRVEVSYQGLWGSICDRNWDDTTAGVVCNMMGFTQGGTAVYQSNFGGGFEVFLDGVQCHQGGETNITQCMSRGYKDQFCTMYRTAGAICLQEYTSNLTGQLRLTGGDSIDEGYLEISYFGVWGTICDTGTGDAAARVACHQLGYASGKMSEKLFQTIMQPVWLSRVVCMGNESAINQCSLPNFRDGQCYKDRVKIECFNAKSLDQMTMIYIIVGILAALVILILIIVVSLVCRSRKHTLYVPSWDTMVKHDQNLRQSTKNPAYSFGPASLWMPSGSQTYSRSASCQYVDTDKYNTSGYSSEQGDYSYILDPVTDNVYLELTDDMDLTPTKSGSQDLTFHRANTPLPDVPDETSRTDDGTYLTPVDSITKYKSSQYLQPLDNSSQPHLCSSNQNILKCTCSAGLNQITATDDNITSSRDILFKPCDNPRYLNIPDVHVIVNGNSAKIPDTNNTIYAIKQYDDAGYVDIPHSMPCLQIG